MYDVAIAYRISPKLSPASRGLPFGTDKWPLATACLHSFAEALGSVRAKVWAILDGCPPEYEELFRGHFRPHQLEIVNTAAIGNRATFDLQLDVLTTQSAAEAVYFAEDDYIYHPDCFRRMLSFLLATPECDFVSPYDHPDCYTLDLHRDKKSLRIFEDHHWRTANSTCLTFMSTRTTLQATQSIFRSYRRGNFDASLWFALTRPPSLSPIRSARYWKKQRWSAKIIANAWRFGFSHIVTAPPHRLWVPVPGLATHLDAPKLSPGVDWNSRILELTRDFAASATGGH